jgi:hypothetical protein
MNRIDTHDESRVKMLVTVRNSFHNTAINLRVSEGEVLSTSQTKRAWKALCGMKDCSCGGRFDTCDQGYFDGYGQFVSKATEAFQTE